VSFEEIIVWLEKESKALVQDIDDFLK